MTLFPATHIVLSGATIYDGIRHLLFTYPPLVVLAAAGWRGSLASPSRRLKHWPPPPWRSASSSPLLFQWRNHPNQAVYFNALAGGPRGAFGRYELDYWGNSLLQGAAVGGSGGASLGHPRRRLRPAAPRRARRRAAFRLARLTRGKTALITWRSCVAARSPPGRPGPGPARRHPPRRHHRRRNASHAWWSRARATPRSKACCRLASPPRALPDRSGDARASQPLLHEAEDVAVPARGPRSGRAGPAAPADPPAVRTTRDRSRTWAAGRRRGRRG